jgi:hydrogenase maturation protein HypF
VRQIPFPIDCKPTLALGADITSAPCLVVGKECHLAEPIHDLSVLENFERFKTAVDELIRVERPEQIVCDLHPVYFSAQYAEDLSKRLNVPLIKVQHHRAHAASCAAEHNLKEYAAIVCDGLGYGDDGTLWGGEVFDGAKRIGSLEPQDQLGGDSAAIYPKRMLFGILAKFMDERALLRFYPEHEVRVYSNQLSERFNVQTTTSCGRILDAASALLCICIERAYEGEPAIRLEQAATGQPYQLESVILRRENRLVLDTTHLFQFLVDNIELDRARLAATVHRYLAEGLLRIASDTKKPIVFSGGVAYNKIISGILKERRVLLHKDIAPGDAGVSFGQAYLANVA